MRYPETHPETWGRPQTALPFHEFMSSKLSPGVQKALEIFIATAGLVGVGVTVWTVENKSVRNLSLALLVVLFLVLVAWIAIPEILRGNRARKALPSREELVRITSQYTVTQATSEEVTRIAELEASVYSAEDAIPERLLREWFSANPSGFSVVKTADGRLIGHLDILPLRPKTLETFLKGDITEHEIRGDSLYTAEDRGLITRLYVESIILCPPKPLSNAVAIVSILSNVTEIVQRVADLSKVEWIYAIAASDAGEAMMRDLGFELHSEGERRRDGHNMFAAQPTVLARNIMAICGRKVAPTTELKTLATGL